MVRLVFYFLSDFRRNVCKTTMMKQDRRPPFTSGQELLGYRECSKFHKKVQLCSGMLHYLSQTLHIELERSEY